MNTQPKTSKLLDPAVRMPPLAHWPDKSVPFDIGNSAAADWLTRQPNIRQWLFEAVRWRELIVFDTEMGTWHGKEWKA